MAFASSCSALIFSLWTFTLFFTSAYFWLRGEPFTSIPVFVWFIVVGVLSSMNEEIGLLDFLSWATTAIWGNLVCPSITALPLWHEALSNTVPSSSEQR